MCPGVEKQIILVTGGSCTSCNLRDGLATTGGNNGIGFDKVATLVGASPNFHVLMGSRNLVKRAIALEKIKTKNHQGSISLIQLDFTDDLSIKAAAD